ncbi:receptor-like serine/threonine-protein kinase NCRK [Vicia villosa]|uniref:receptor-like serine/threonine-protein kinase NCRK n=1 Tax=Vicia villosa TaxID=3911 RepID=UPI00273C4B07|nr:receptor-like serine/threonine-protein kinase NCRK [Vicia villosa]
MKHQLKVSFALIISFLWFQQSFSNEPSDTGLNKWECRCSFRGNQRYSIANCSKSCDCHSESASIWTCICDSNGFPEVATDIDNPNCFIACNCIWGTAKMSLGSKSHISSKIVIIILVMSITSTTIAFLALFLCYARRRKRPHPIQSPMNSSSDKETSYNNTSNFISRKTSFVRETKGVMNSPISHITRCFRKASVLLGSQRETFHGNIIQFSFAELENATENFSASNLIGLGGSSYVYRGRLKNGSNVAVKRLKVQGGPEADTEFFTEIELLSRLHHCHLVPLIGYCSELKGKNVQRLLVFDYMSNGNLRDRLDGIFGKNMDWSTRVTIALGAARGLEYLHEAAAPRILHRDVKSTNILLDKNWQAKITDLGLAKDLRSDDLRSCSDSSERMKGTFGYFAPEYAIVGRASIESDVFSFGVVLLELITGRQPILRSAGKEESLVVWATPLLRDSRRVMTELADPQLKGNFPEDEVHIMANLAKECLLLDPDNRPTMSEVVLILSSISRTRSRRRRYIQLCLFQEPEEEEKPRQASWRRFPHHNSLPRGTDYNLRVENEDKNVDTISTEYMKSLILLTSKGESWHASEEDMVDLSEPRLESFSMTNINFP